MILCSCLLLHILFLLPLPVTCFTASRFTPTPFFSPTLFVSVKLPCHPWLLPMPSSASAGPGSFCLSLSEVSLFHTLLSPTSFHGGHTFSLSLLVLLPKSSISIFSNITYNPFPFLPIIFMLHAVPSSALFFDFSSEHPFVFTIFLVSLCRFIQFLCWIAPSLPSVSWLLSSFSSPHTKAYWLALISPATFSDLCFLYSSFLKTFLYLSAAYLRPFSPCSLSLSLLITSIPWVFICLSLFPAFLLSRLFLSQGLLLTFSLLHASPYPFTSLLLQNS